MTEALRQQVVRKPHEDEERGQDECRDGIRADDQPTREAGLGGRDCHSDGFEGRNGEADFERVVLVLSSLDAQPLDRELALRRLDAVEQAHDLGQRDVLERDLHARLAIEFVVGYIQ